LENIPKHVDFVEDWQCLIWAEALFHWTPIFEKYVIGMDIKEDAQKNMCLVDTFQKTHNNIELSWRLIAMRYVM
jgi:hypothetical protein